MQLRHQRRAYQNFQAMSANSPASPSIQVVEIAQAAMRTPVDNWSASIALPTVNALKMFDTTDIAPADKTQPFEKYALVLIYIIV